MVSKSKKWCARKTQHSFRGRSDFCGVVLQLFPDVFDGTAVPSKFPVWKELSRQVGLQNLYCLQESACPRPVSRPVVCPITSPLPRGHLKRFYEVAERGAACRPL